MKFLKFFIFLLIITFTSACSCISGETPVCGSDGQTYAGACILSCANFRRIQFGQPEVSIAHNGPCKN